MGGFGVILIGFFVVLLVAGVVFLVAMVVVIIFLLVVLGRTTGDVVVVERDVVDRWVALDVVEEAVVSVISILSVEEDGLDEEGLKLVWGGFEFPVEGCNGRYPIGNWPLKFVAKINGNK